MATALDLKGKRFGSLVALERYENDQLGRAQWVCVCDCGGGHIVRASYLKEGRSTRCMACSRAGETLRIEAWYHTSLLEAVGGGYSQGSAGFCIARRNGTTVLEPLWVDKPHVSRRPSPVLVDTVRRLAKAELITCPTDNAHIGKWIRRHSAKIDYHIHNEGDAVWAAWHKLTGEWKGPART